MFRVIVRFQTTPSDRLSGRSLLRGKPTMRTKRKISGYIRPTAACVSFLAIAIAGLSSAFNLSNISQTPSCRLGPSVRKVNSAKQGRTLTFAKRVAYQRAIEEVYWHHRIWPTASPDVKPLLKTVMSQARLEKKVTDYLRKSQALEDYWQRPITAEQLQAEMDRIPGTQSSRKCCANYLPRLATTRLSSRNV